MSEFVTAWQINDKSRPELFERYLFVLRPHRDHRSSSVDTWAGKVNAIIKRVDILEGKMDQKVSGVDEKICALEAKIDTKFTQMLQALEILRTGPPANSADCLHRSPFGNLTSEILVDERFAFPRRRYSCSSRTNPDVSMRGCGLPELKIFFTSSSRPCQHATSSRASFCLPSCRLSLSCEIKRNGRSHGSLPR